MRVIHIRAARDEDAECLVRELAVYQPKRLPGAVLIELEGPSQIDLLAMLTAVETCVAANGIGSIALEVDGQKYMLEAR